VSPDFPWWAHQKPLEATCVCDGLFFFKEMSFGKVYWVTKKEKKNQLSDNKWDHVPKMHASGGGPSARVQVEQFSFLVKIEEDIQISAMII
jgi:hypothetical protein